MEEARSEEARCEEARCEAARCEAARCEEARSEEARGEEARGEEARGEAARCDEARCEALKSLLRLVLALVVLRPRRRPQVVFEVAVRGVKVKVAVSALGACQRPASLETCETITVT